VILQLLWDHCFWVNSKLCSTDILTFDMHLLKFRCFLFKEECFRHDSKISYVTLYAESSYRYKRSWSRKIWRIRCSIFVNLNIRQSFNLSSYDSCSIISSSGKTISKSLIDQLMCTINKLNITHSETWYHALFCNRNTSHSAQSMNEQLHEKFHQ
jgi:hypothetical protein